MNFIVKNCPAFVSGKPNKCIAYTRGICHTKTNCLIKQIIENLKEPPFCYCSCGNDILQLFEIEEQINDMENN
mgnify:CR=1 FL=1